MSIRPAPAAWRRPASARGQAFWRRCRKARTSSSWPSKGSSAQASTSPRHLDDLALRGASELAFVIGGSDGVSDAVRARADETFSFGPVTLPHNLARVVLLEQLYRAFKISRGEPYHK